jgi:hypothetical protein
MTRVLSELLGATEPSFLLGLQQLERASGEPKEDIRLSTEVASQLRSKLRDLGLDPNDTTGKELYNALQERLKHDDEAVRELLGANDGTVNVIQLVQTFLDAMDIPKRTFALKASAAKRLLKKLPPKKAMKRLGYRSVDSMLKHEPVPQIYAAAFITESLPWQKQFIAQYKQLLPTDFESRNIKILVPNNKHWDTIGERYVNSEKQNILMFKELGTVIMLQLPDETMPGAAITTLLLALHAIDDIRSVSAYLKLHQVRPDFGNVVASVVVGDPYTKANLIGERLPWKLIQRYFARTPNSYNPDLFEPHVQPEDLATTSAEDILAKLHDRFAFWKDSAHIGMLDNGLPVSLNITDAALNFCNKLPYEQRVVHYLRDHLWHELMMRYMHQHNLEELVNDQLNNELVDQRILA